MAKIDMPTSSLNQTPGQQPKKKLEKVTTGKVTVRQQTDIQKVANIRSTTRPRSSLAGSWPSIWMTLHRRKLWHRH